MGLLSSIFSPTTTISGNQLPEIYPFSVVKSFFIQKDIINTYTQILTDTMNRVQGVPEKVDPLLWDNYLQSESNCGLISLLANAMADKSDLFLVYKSGVLRTATHEEQQQIRLDYKEKAQSSVGVYISFKNYHRTDMLEIYSSFEYCALSSLNKVMNLASAIQIKASKLRDSVALKDKNIPAEQARSIAEGLSLGLDVLLDKEDEIVTASPETAAHEKALSFLDSKRAFYLGLPMSYISGLQTPGIGSTGEADMRAVERGLRQYYVSILRPALEAIFTIKTEYRSQDFRQLDSALNALRTMELVSSDFFSNELKAKVLERVFELQAGDLEIDEDVDTSGTEKDSEEDGPEEEGREASDV